MVVPLTGNSTVSNRSRMYESTRGTGIGMFKLTCIISPIENNPKYPPKVERTGKLWGDMHIGESIPQNQTSYCCMQRGIGESHRHENKEKKPDTKTVLCDFICMELQDRQN